jgi:hypothetical protein
MVFELDRQCCTISSLPPVGGPNRLKIKADLVRLDIALEPL